jgi:hypothetical protein
MLASEACTGLSLSCLGALILAVGQVKDAELSSVQQALESERAVVKKKDADLSSVRMTLQNERPTGT